MSRGYLSLMKCWILGLVILGMSGCSEIANDNAIRVEIISSILLSGLEDSLWNMNQSRVDLLIQQTMKDPAVFAVIIVDERGSLIHLKNKSLSTGHSIQLSDLPKLKQTYSSLEKDIYNSGTFLGKLFVLYDEKQTYDNLPEHSLTSMHRIVLENLSSSLKELLWNIDQSGAKSILTQTLSNGYMNNGEYLTIAVVDHTGKIFVAQSLNAQGEITDIHNQSELPPETPKLQSEIVRKETGLLGKIVMYYPEDSAFN